MSRLNNDASLSVGETPVTYIGRRESWVDNNYGTGLTFVSGQTRNVPGLLAQKLLRHQDVFELAGKPATEADDTAAVLEAASKQQGEQHEDVDRRNNLVADVMNMEKAALKSFASTHYKQDLNGKFKVETLREQVVGLIDQYGIS